MHNEIGGNISAVVQTKTSTQNEIGEDVVSWTDYKTLWGWLDLMSGTKTNDLRSFIEEATDVFVCDYVDLNGITPHNSRIVCNGKIYNIEYIDNPMEMGEDSQTEIYLRFLEWQ